MPVIQRFEINYDNPLEGESETNSSAWETENTRQDPPGKSVLGGIGHMLGAACLVVILCSPSVASGEDICGNIKFWDSREDRDSSFGSRVEPMSDPNDFNASYGSGIVIQLYDQDGTCNDFEWDCSDDPDDDFWAETTTGAGGNFCFYDINPKVDAYLRSRMETEWFQVVNTQGYTINRYTQTYPDFGDNGDLTLDWNLTCWQETDGLCDSEGQVDLEYPVSEDWAAMLKTMSEIEYWIPESDLTRNNIESRFYGYFPDWNDGDCDRQEDYHKYCVTNGLDNHRIAHEIGHLLHKRALYDSSQLNAGACDGGWGLNSSEDEKCATTEGWASFFSAMIHYTWYASAPKFQGELMEGDTTLGNSGNALNCASQGSNPHRRPVNVARMFWDLYDGTTIDDDRPVNYADDNESVSITDLLDSWDLFVAGYDNRETRESDDNGRNVWDFRWYPMYYALGYDPFSEMYENCLEAQDTN